MNIHEYQAKEVLRGFGVPVPAGQPAFSVEEAVKAAEALGGPVWVVKAQIHAGGRGKGGGVKVVKSIEDVKKEAQRMLGMTLVTHQTGPQGRLVKRLYIEDGSAIDRELYLSALVDRATSRIAFIVSTEGGMDIEEVAHKTPEKIHTFQIEPAAGYSPYVGNEIAVALGLKGDQAKQIGQVVKKLYEAFQAHHQRDLQRDFLGGGDDAFGDDVALHDAAEDVDQDALHVRVADDDLEGLGHFFLGGAAAHVQEVGRLAAIELDDVHRRHGQAGPIDHAADLAIQLDVGEVVFAGFDFRRVFLVQVAQRLHVLVAVERVVVEVQLSIQRQHIAGDGRHERIDFDE
jgi:succinyl-CoA synthetase beta subunit